MKYTDKPVIKSIKLHNGETFIIAQVTGVGNLHATKAEPPCDYCNHLITGDTCIGLFNPEARGILIHEKCWRQIK